MFDSRASQRHEHGLAEQWTGRKWKQIKVCASERTRDG